MINTKKVATNIQVLLARSVSSAMDNSSAMRDPEIIIAASMKKHVFI
jgi:hypothetical protein